MKIRQSEKQGESNDGLAPPCNKSVKFTSVKMSVLFLKNQKRQNRIIIKNPVLVLLLIHRVTILSTSWNHTQKPRY